jgi:peptidoglycan/LPS O-acetylase OafA/YrhL
MTSIGKTERVGVRQAGGSRSRVYYIDWLRVIAVLVLIPFHTARIFDIWEPFYVKSEQVSTALTYVFIGAVGSWHMPLFFLLAGASTWFALGFRSGRQYVGERLKRLLIPLAFGVLALVPPQSYLGALTYRYFRGSFFQYYPQFFRIGPTSDLSGYMGGFTPGHLWFILFLFVLSLAALPLFLYLRSEAGQRLVGRLATWFAWPGAIFLPAIPLGLAQLLPDIGGKNPVYYLVLFVYGYLLMADARFEDVLDRTKAIALAVGMGAMGVGLALWAFGVTGWVTLVAGFCYECLATWCLLVAILGFGRKYLNFTNRALKYASEAAYPFYVLHQTVILIVGFYVVQWHIGVPAQFSVIVIAATAATLLVYEVLVRRTSVTRLLFGMKPKIRRQKHGLPHAVQQEA